MTDTLTVNGVVVVVKDRGALARLGSDWLRILIDKDRDSPRPEGGRDAEAA